MATRRARVPLVTSCARRRFCRRVLRWHVTGSGTSISAAAGEGRLASRPPTSRGSRMVSASRRCSCWSGSRRRSASSLPGSAAQPPPPHGGREHRPRPRPRSRSNCRRSRRRLSGSAATCTRRATNPSSAASRRGDRHQAGVALCSRAVDEAAPPQLRSSRSGRSTNSATPCGCQTRFATRDIEYLQAERCFRIPHRAGRCAQVIGELTAARRVGNSRRPRAAGFDTRSPCKPGNRRGLPNLRTLRVRKLTRQLGIRG